MRTSREFKLAQPAPRCGAEMSGREGAIRHPPSRAYAGARASRLIDTRDRGGIVSVACARRSVAKERMRAARRARYSLRPRAVSRESRRGVTHSRTCYLPGISRSLLPGHLEPRCVPLDARDVYTRKHATVPPVRGQHVRAESVGWDPDSRPVFFHVKALGNRRVVGVSGFRAAVSDTRVLVAPVTRAFVNSSVL